MKSLKRGKRTSRPVITNISRQGFWIFLKDKEYFLPYVKFPWFKDAAVADLTDIKMLHRAHLYWPKLDVGFSIDIIKHHEKYIMIAK